MANASRFVECIQQRQMYARDARVFAERAARKIIKLNEVNKLSMLRALENGRYLSMSFCSWELYEIPPIVEYNEFDGMGYQDCDSTRKTAIYEYYL